MSKAGGGFPLTQGKQGGRHSLTQRQKKKHPPQSEKRSRKVQTSKNQLPRKNLFFCFLLKQMRKVPYLVTSLRFFLGVQKNFTQRNTFLLFFFKALKKRSLFSEKCILCAKVRHFLKNSHFLLLSVSISCFECKMIHSLSNKFSNRDLVHNNRTRKMDFTKIVSRD